LTPQIVLLIAVALGTLGLLAWERIPSDVVALVMLLTLVLTGLLPADQAFSGFSSDTVIVILGLLLLTTALHRTGVIDLAGRAIVRHVGTDQRRLLLVITISATALSAFMSNTAAAAFFLPIVFGLAQRARTSPAKLLMPLAFASILASSISLFSTSTNIVVSGLMKAYKMEPMGMFELAPVGIPIAIVGLLYLHLIGTRLIPDRFGTDAAGSTTNARPYLSEVLIQPQSPLVGRTLSQSALGRDLDLKVLRIIRNKTEHLQPHGNTVFEAHDVVVVEGASEEILRIKDVSGIEIKADVKLTDPNLASGDLSFIEVVLLPRSALVGRSLKGFGFRERFDLQVIGVSRHGSTFFRKISDLLLRVGDILLVQGAPEKIAQLDGDEAFRVIGALGENRPKLGHAPLAISIFVGVLVLATFEVVSMPVAVMLGVATVFLTRCIAPDQAYRELEWKAIILIACMLSLGTAMEHTGTAAFLANVIVSQVGHFGPLALLSGFFLVTVLLTQPMSNQAAAIVILPVAFQTAFQLDLNPRTFAMMIAVAASCSYLTPLEPACLMVYGPGRYRFLDFIRVGALLTALIYIIAILLVPRLWPVTQKFVSVGF
jgi:di/tricarboxylate transporter